MLKQIFFIALMVLSCFGEIHREFYQKANNKYFSYVHTDIDSYSCDVEEHHLKKLKSSIDVNSKDSIIEQFRVEASYTNRVNLSSASLLNPVAQVSFEKIPQSALRNQALKYNQLVLSEIRGVNATTKGFYFTDTYFDTTGYQKDRLEKTDTGYVFRPFGKEFYKVFLDKEYLVTSWFDDVKTQKGLIHTVIKPQFIDYKGKALISGYSVDVAYGKLTSEVSIEYDLSGDLPLPQKISIRTEMRGRESSTELYFSNYRKHSF